MNTAVYKITNTVNGKLYIGISANPTKRWWGHRNQTKRTHTKLYNAFKKHGVEAFNFEVLHWCETREDARELENLVVDVCEAITKGYNMCPGGGGGVAGPDNPFYGKPLSQEVRAKMSAAAKQRRATPETRARMSEARKGRKQSPEWVEKRAAKKRGTQHSDAHRAKLSEAWVERKKKHAQPGAILVRCNETGEIFSSASVAAKHFGVCTTIICRYLKGNIPKKPKLSVTFSKVS